MAVTLLNIWREITAPYVLIIAVVAGAITIYVALDSGLSVPKGAFVLGQIMIGIMLGKAIVLMMSDAPNVSVIFYALAAVLLLVVLHFIDVTVFKDLVVEGMLLNFGSQSGVLLDAAIERRNRRRGIVVESTAKDPDHLPA